MSKFSTIKPGYEIATGDTNFEAMSLSGSKNIVAVEMSGLDSADVSIELHQSIDGSTWGVISESRKTLAIDQTSHQWNIQGLLSGAFLRVSLRKGTATAGVISQIKLLSDE